MFGLVGMVGFFVVAALPAVGAPALLVDIETAPSRVVRPLLVEATADGVLFTQFERDGSNALWWSGWDGPPQRVAAVLDGGLRARPLGSGFITFGGTAQQVDIARLDVAPVLHVEPLTTAADVSSFAETDSPNVWWSGTAGTFTTDGTPDGTRRVTSLVAPGVVLGGRIYYTNANELFFWENDQIVDTGLTGPYRRAGHHLVLAGPVNELGVALTDPRPCNTFGGGEVAWLSCDSGDGGRDLLVTDGTPEGTVTRVVFRGDDRLSELERASRGDAILLGNWNGAFGRFFVTRAGPGGPAPASLSIGQLTAVFGDTLVGQQGVSSMQQGGDVRLDGIEASRAAGRRAVLQLQAEPRFLLTDGTDAGSRFVPTQTLDWPTGSSEPVLLDSDGTHALFQTTHGVWMTDGTAKGTLRVGDAAEFFGHSVLATDDGHFVAWDSKGKSWTPPDGVIGIAGGLLVGRSGCDAFSVDEDRVRHPLRLSGCVDQIEAGKQGALVRNADGLSWLVRAGHDPFPLKGDVHFPSGVHCGIKGCWYLTSEATTFRANYLTLETGAVTLVPTILTTDGLPPPGASDVALVMQQNVFGQLHFFAVALDGQQRVITQPFAFASDGTLAWLTGGGLTLLGKGGDSAVSFTCLRPDGLSVTGDRLNALCLSLDLKQTLFSGTLAEGLQPIAVADQSPQTQLLTLPSGGKVAAFSVISWVAPNRLVVTDGTDRLELSGVSGGDFAQVRGGFVFVGNSDVDPDPELWVLPVPQSGCGCGAGGGNLFALGLLVLVLKRRVRLNVPVRLKRVDQESGAPRSPWAD